MLRVWPAALALLTSALARPVALVDPHLTIAEDPARLAAADAFRATPQPRASDAPSIVVILADDLGYYDTSLYGGTPSTPNLDRLASQGARCTAGYVVSPICAPSRAGLLTGRYPQRFGYEIINHERYPHNRLERGVARGLVEGQGWEIDPDVRVPPAEAIAAQGLPRAELALSEVLKQAGYETAIFGKWHLGTAPDKVPLARGFDHHYGFLEAFSLYAPPEDPDVVALRQDYYADRYEWKIGRSGASAIRADGVEVDEPAYLTDRIAEEAVAYLRAPHTNPVFVYVPFSAPHTPLQAPRDRWAAITDAPSPEARVYRAMIGALDDGVGRILDAIDAAGKSEQTLVFFLSDNGGATYTGATDNGPLAGGKFSNLEGGVRVPFLVRGPGVPVGATCDAPVSALDVFQTSVAAAGARLPTDRPYDGVDLRPYLAGASGPPHPALYWRAGGASAVLQGRYKLISDETTGAVALYDLSTDPGESTNLSRKNPEIVSDMSALLQTWEADLRAPLWPPVMRYRTVHDGLDWLFPL